MLTRLALVILFGQVFGLLFCGDIGCLEGNSADGCKALLCNLLASRSNHHSQSDSHQHKSCQGACNISISFHPIDRFAASLEAMPYFEANSLLFFSIPLRPIDHIPLA
jgi:hypothetical protein